MIDHLKKVSNNHSCDILASHFNESVCNMSSRRNFIKTGAFVAAGAAVSGSTVNAKENTDSNVSSGYSYKRPKLAKGTRLVFQGDSITDMKWGRNEKDRNHYLGHSYVFLIW